MIVLQEIKLIMYLKANPNNLHLVEPVNVPPTGLSFQIVDAVPSRSK